MGGSPATLFLGTYWKASNPQKLENIASMPTINHPYCKSSQACFASMDMENNALQLLQLLCLEENMPESTTSSSEVMFSEPFAQLAAFSKFLFTSPSLYPVMVQTSLNPGPYVKLTVALSEQFP